MEEQVLIDLTDVLDRLPTSSISNDFIELIKTLEEQDIQKLINSFEEKGLVIHPFGSPLLEEDLPSSQQGLQRLDLRREDITVTSVSDSIARIEFTATEVSLPGIIETRVRVVNFIPRVETRQRFRKLNVSIDVDRNSFINLPGFTNLSSPDLTDAVVAFLLCALALIVVTAALAATLVTGGLTLAALLFIFQAAIGVCGLVIAGVAAADGLNALSGSTSTEERWGSWG